LSSVLSDPGYDNGNDERVFINTIGSAWNYTPRQLDETFFDSDIYEALKDTIFRVGQDRICTDDRFVAIVN
jgi:hypothetical protein